MGKTFRRVEASLPESASLENIVRLGRISLKLGTLFPSSSKVAIAIAGDGTRTYELDFLVLEEMRETASSDVDVILVKDLFSFVSPCPILYFADARIADRGGHILFLSYRGDELRQYSTVATESVREYSKPSV